MFSRHYFRVTVATSVFVVLANLLIACFLWPLARHNLKGESQYTYFGESYPMRWEIPSFARPVEMTFHESEAYAVDGTFADVLWTSNRRFQTHSGYVRFGPDQRLFAISMFHQLHCVNTFRRALTEVNETNYNDHVQHCLSYLRQFFLCGADDTLEPGDFAVYNHRVRRVGHTRVCRDWSAVYDAAEVNWSGWSKLKASMLKIFLELACGQ